MTWNPIGPAGVDGGMKRIVLLVLVVVGGVVAGGPAVAGGWAVTTLDAAARKWRR